MRKTWVRGKLLRIEGRKKIHVIKFDGATAPTWVRPDLIYDSDVEEPGESGLFQIPEWLAANEELAEAEIGDPYA